MTTEQQMTQRMQFDIATIIAVACILIGWFLMSTLVTRVGRLELPFRFYEMGALIAKPALIVMGMGSGQSAKTILFGILCVLAAAAPLVPYFRKTSAGWLLSAAPLVLMVICGVLFYTKVSPPYFQADSDSGALGQSLVDIANDLAGRMTGVVARRVSVGVGAYVSLAASIVVLVRGWTQFRRRSPAAE